MPAKHPRFNIVLDTDLARFIGMIAKREDKSMSVVAKELLTDAIEKHEDYLLSQIAMQRESQSKKVVKHKNAWG